MEGPWWVQCVSQQIHKLCGYKLPRDGEVAGVLCVLTNTQVAIQTYTHTDGVDAPECARECGAEPCRDCVLIGAIDAVEHQTIDVYDDAPHTSPLLPCMPLRSVPTRRSPGTQPRVSASAIGRSRFAASACAA